MMRTLAFAALCAFIAPARAGTLDLSKTGGASLQTTTLSLKGDAGLKYLLLFSIDEQTTPISPSVTLQIPLTFLEVATLIPNFTGQLDGAGKASASFVLPDDPVILGLTLSFQAVGGQTAITTASDLVRLTPAQAGTFEDALTAAPLPISGGAIHVEADGKLLFVGGTGLLTESYDPELEEFAVEGPAFGVGVLGQSTALADGRFLFTGGLGLDGQPTSDAAVYDPATGTTTTLSMLVPRAGHGASRMPNGKVLITGGFQAFALTDLVGFLQGIQGTSEIFDPATNTFSNGPALLEPRALHTSTAMSNGKVLIAGGLTLIPIVNLPTVSNTAYAYNPLINSFGLPIFFTGARMLHSAVELTNGKVLLVGGLSLDLSSVLTSGDLTQLAVGTLSDCQLFTSNIISGSFATVGGLSEPRAGAGVAALPGGGALIAGGFNVALSGTNIGLTTSTSADRFTQGPNALAPTGALATPRVMPLIQPLNDGTVLVAGGGPLTAEIYQP